MEEDGTRQERMNVGIARIFDAVKKTIRGTAFAISPELGLTAFHCIGKRNNGEITSPRMRLLFLGGASVEAEYLDGEPQADFAVLRFRSQLPAGLRTIPLTLDVMAFVRFRCTGYPAHKQRADIMSIHGDVVDSRGSVSQVLQPSSCFLTKQRPSCPLRA